MNFDRATIQYPDGRVAQLPPQDFYAIPLGERIELRHVDVVLVCGITDLDASTSAQG